MCNFTFFHNVFYAIWILKSFNSHVSVVFCSFFEFRMVSKWCIGEWVKVLLIIVLQTLTCSELLIANSRVSTLTSDGITLHFFNSSITQSILVWRWRSDNLLTKTSIFFSITKKYRNVGGLILIMTNKHLINRVKRVDKTFLYHWFTKYFILNYVVTLFKASIAAKITQELIF